MVITTAGESHGKGLIAILEGIPAGLAVNVEEIDAALARRQRGYGRSARQQIERDCAEILSGVRGGVTTGSPIALAVWNVDREEEGRPAARLTAVRPGHADLAGMLKFGQDDARAISERASARETAVRVAAGEICRRFLREFGVEIAGYTVSIGPVCDGEFRSFAEIAGADPETGMLDPALVEAAKGEIDACRAAGDSCGGVAELRVKGLKSGFGSCMTYAEKLDARLSGALFSVQSVKGVEVGLGFRASLLRGSAFHDEIGWGGAGYFRKTNRAGGMEGGMSNGEELVLRAALKPIPTLARGLATVDTDTKLPARSQAVRSDVCALPAAISVLEAALAAELTSAVLDRLGGDTLGQVKERYEALP